MQKYTTKINDQDEDDKIRRTQQSQNLLFSGRRSLDQREDPPEQKKLIIFLGAPWVHILLTTVTAIVIGLFIELRNCLSSMSTPGDPAASGGGPDRPCGITSLLPIGMSCRGRAEAFARSLQSRLRTLGTQGNADEELQITDQLNQGENTWISQEETPVTRLQPLRMVANEADSFFDFGIDNESPGSPVEECEYTRLIETATATPAEIATESGYVCASPCSTPQVSQENSPSSQSSSDCQFYDPESSDPEQKSVSGCDYYDCTTTSDPSTASASLSARTHKSTSAEAEAESTNVVRLHKKHQNGHLPSGIAVVAVGDSDSCSESLPPSQSTESRDSTYTGLSSNNSNSTLQDVTMEGDEASATTGVETTNSESKAHDEPDSSGKVLSNGHAVAPRGTVMNEESRIEKFELNQTYNIDVLKFINGDAEEEPEEEDLSPQVELAEVEKKLQDCGITQEDETKQQDHKREGLSSGDEDEDFSRPQRIRRCSSLKTGKTPPGTPGRKKIVRFADVLGLDLADVKTFVDEVPKIPKSAYEDLEINLEPTMPVQQICLGPKADRVLVPLFQQPGALPCFLDRVRDKQVNLENAAVTDPVNLTITGTVRVRNLDFHKSVYVRYTTDNWRSFSDLQASYVENSCDGFSDKFTFTIYGTSVQIGQRIEMAIRFHCRGQQFWDSNYDTNYVFQCLPISQPNHIANMAVKPANIESLISPDEAWCKSFY
ncbi:glycogen-binding subunit 76A isoform X2 [Uranotaenia lowii]|uniref:glycogen-binding subunit 76A isoform X2 n=1 Tax=Uranotaenia lowii TaxID=190385 RepID=UPI00247A6FFD|nr:glycogen-binding subunit 76A isoform X2 [Uranotaenia lowii]